MALFSLYAAALPCISQTNTCMAGIDMTGLLDNQVTARLYYSFSSHWSLSGEASIPFSILVKPASDTEKKHHAEFVGPQVPASNSAGHYERLSLSYWPAEAFKGISISAGVRTSGMKDIICLAELGYMFHIWNNIHINTSVQVPLGASQENAALSCKNIRISLSYKF